MPQPEFGEDVRHTMKKGARTSGWIRKEKTRAAVVLLVLTLSSPIWIPGFGALAAAGKTGPIEGRTLDGRRPEFSARDIQGKRVNLNDFRGQRLLVVFFATCCCLFCPEEMPALGRMERELAKKGISVLGVSIDSARMNVIRQYLKKWGVEFPVVYDEEGDLFRAFRVEGIPTAYFVGPDGRLDGRTSGGLELTRWDTPQVRRILKSWAEGKNLPFEPVSLEKAETPSERKQPDD